MFLLTTESLGTIALSAWYQFVDRAWLTLHVIIFVTSIFTTAYTMIFVPESPKWLVSRDNFGEAREVL